MPASLLRLPALDLLRGFVAVGRRMSITQAAADLCLTQSAISKQVRQLEQVLHVRLFHRGFRCIRFTDEGQRLFLVADTALQQLQEVMGGLQGREEREVTITASLGVIGLWLLPKLNSFQQQYPGVGVRVTASNALMDLSAEGIDLAIRYCASAQAPAGARRLFGETVAVVGSPELGLERVREAKDLEGHVLLEFDDPKRTWLHWTRWQAARDWQPIPAKAMLRFNQYDQLMHAVMAGQGVALGRLELLDPLLRHGRLVQLSEPDAAVAGTHAYWLIQAESATRSNVEAVARWIMAQASLPGMRQPHEIPS